MGTQVPETPLYHYCGAEAFFSILKDRRLRAGQLSTMNDSAEYTWLFDIARKRMSDRMGTSVNYSHEEYIALGGACSLLDEPIKTDPYSICLSEEGDLLSQWRAYADQGRGFSIGFKSAAVKKGFMQTHPIVYLGKVNYDQASHESIVDEAIKEWEVAMRNDPQSIEAAQKLRAKLMQHGPLCKNPAFIEEAEWRFIYLYRVTKTLTDESDTFDIKNGAIVQYHYATFDRLFDVPDVIEHIYLGPKNPMKPDHRSLKAFLHACGFHGVEVLPSKSTLR
jgi:hypothetical protein